MDSHLVFIFYAFMLGGLAAVSLPHVLVVGIEGIAAGAMLTMIGATMLPGAAHIGGGSAAATSRVKHDVRLPRRNRIQVFRVGVGLRGCPCKAV